MIDVETTDGVSPAAAAEAVATWVDLVEAGTGRRPIVYTGSYFWNDNVQTTALNEHPLWIAHYTTGCPNLPGFPDEAGTLALYESLSGRTVKNIDYYIAFSGLRFGLIWLRLMQRAHDQGAMPMEALRETELRNPTTQLLAEQLGLPTP